MPILLMAGLGCYAACQWMLLSSIAGCRFFNPRHEREVEEFYEFNHALATELLVACQAGQVGELLFSDDDVALPYLLGELERRPDCRPVRETAVTPFSAEELRSCSAIFISEDHPPRPPVETPPPGMQVLARRRIGSGEFGFTLYRREAGCGEVGG